MNVDIYPGLRFFCFFVVTVFFFFFVIVCLFAKPVYQRVRKKVLGKFT